MSKGTKQPLAKARNIAWILVERMRPYCERIEVGGSVRRGEPWVGDIEIVVVPKMGTQITRPAGLFEPAKEEPKNLLWEYLDGLMAQGAIAHPAVKGWGNLYRKFVLTTDMGQSYKIDVFTAEMGNWGNQLLIRTGSREFSTFMVTERARGGALPAGYQHKGGWLYGPDGAVVPLYREEDWFEVCGLDFVLPAQRSQFGVPR